MGCTPARSATAMGDGAAEVRAALATDMGVVWLKVWLAEGVTPSGVPLTLREKKRHQAQQTSSTHSWVGGGAVMCHACGATGNEHRLCIVRTAAAMKQLEARQRPSQAAATRGEKNRSS